jgi:hypothetical protein
MAEVEFQKVYLPTIEASCQKGLACFRHYCDAVRHRGEAFEIAYCVDDTAAPVAMLPRSLINNLVSENGHITYDSADILEHEEFDEILIIEDRHKTEE